MRKANNHRDNKIETVDNTVRDESRLKHEMFG